MNETLFVVSESLYLLNFCGVLGGSSEDLFGFLELSLLAVDVSGQVKSWNGVWDFGQDLVDVLLSFREVFKEEGVDPDEVELSHDSCGGVRYEMSIDRTNTHKKKRKEKKKIHISFKKRKRLNAWMGWRKRTNL